MELWKALPGYEGLYEVSDQGRVRSLERFDTYGTGRRVPERILSISNGGGNSKTGYHYAQVALTRNGVRASKLLHRLVLAAFVGPPPEDHQTCHKNGNRFDNRLENLRYGTAQDNANDRIRHGNNVSPRSRQGEDHPLSKLTDADVRAIRAWPWRKPGLRAQWPHLASATIYHVRAGRSWKHVT